MNARMNNLCGTVVIGEHGAKYILENIIGNGGQGIVYSEKSGKYLVKLYYPTGSKSIEADMLEKLAFVKNVKKPQYFVEVLDIISAPYIGYVMERVYDHSPLNTYLFPPSSNGLSFADWYNQGHGLRERLFLGYMIAKAFSALSSNNLSYCDISGNNILVKKNAKGKNLTLSVKMIDVDNIYVAGRGKAFVLGTPRYIAPEVISKEKNPDILSDNYSLAVILFELLRCGHPYVSDQILDGPPEMEDNAYAGKYDYVTDENSTKMLPANIVFTEKLDKLFRRCFVDGKVNRLARPSAREFEYALLEASNKLICCPSCNAWHYPRKQGRKFLECPWCDAVSKPDAWLNFYDFLYSETSYRNQSQAVYCPLINSYILHEGKNYIKCLYVLRFDDFDGSRNISDNYLTIAKDDKGYHAYNEFGKDGIVIKCHSTQSYTVLRPKAEMLLKSGDEIFFEISCNNATLIECGGKHYSFIRAARFMEEAK